jgi:hypothetical protein
MAVVNVRVGEPYLPIVFVLFVLRNRRLTLETLFLNCIHNRNWKMDTIFCSGWTWAHGAFTGEATPCSVIGERDRSSKRFLTFVGGSVPIVSCHCPHTIALSNYIICDSLMSTTVPVIRSHRLPFICMQVSLELYSDPKREINRISYLTASAGIVYKELDLSLNLWHRLTVYFVLLCS